jgi:hypothetical protein
MFRPVYLYILAGWLPCSDLSIYLFWQGGCRVPICLSVYPGRVAAMFRPVWQGGSCACRLSRFFWLSVLMCQKVYLSWQ